MVGGRRGGGTAGCSTQGKAVGAGGFRLRWDVSAATFWPSLFQLLPVVKTARLE